MRKKKILLLNYEFPPLGGGAANATWHMLKVFANNPNIEIDLITSSVGKYKKEYFAPNITIYFLDIGKNNTSLHYQTQKDLLKYAWKSYWFAKSLCKNNTYTTIHAFFGIPSGVVAFFLSLIQKIPFIISLRGSDVPFYNARFKWLDTFLFQYISRYIWKKSDHVIANSEGLSSLAKKTSPYQKVSIIPNGVDTDFFQAIPYAPDSTCFTVLFVGRLIDRKGIDILLQGFALFLKNHKNIRLWIAGDGNKATELQSLAKSLNIDPYVTFFGRKNTEELRNLYRAATVYILPSANEGMSNTLLEAIASGLPVIVSNTGGTQELVQKNGIILTEVSDIAICDALKKMYDNPDLVQQLSNDSIKIANNWTWKTMAEQYFNFYL